MLRRGAPFRTFTAGASAVEDGDLLFELGDGRSICVIDIAEEFCPEEDNLDTFSPALA